MGAGAAASIIDWLFDLRQNGWSHCAQGLCPARAAFSSCPNMFILITSSLNTSANPSQLGFAKGYRAGVERTLDSTMLLSQWVVSYFTATSEAPEERILETRHRLWWEIPSWKGVGCGM